MRMTAPVMAGVVDTMSGAAKDDDSLRCRFSLMVRCEEPACRRTNMITAGQDITALQSRRFFCYMNKRGDSSKCCHIQKPGEVWVPRRRADSRPSVTAGSKVAGKRRDRTDWSRASLDSSSSDSSRSQSTSPRSADNVGFGGISAEPYAVGANIMVLHGKTVYPGKVLDRKVDSMVYLVQYDGLSASRSEWREHAEVISIDEVISNRRSCREF
eukprot:m.119838 g.119838  ORF g.119838 m.119838 type:complete len:213 (+) comp21819_c0_seq1:152-790(+)